MSAAIGELMGRVFNRYTGLADLAPGFVALEDGLLRWLASLFCLPANANGLLTTGGSQAMLSMILAAREQHASHGDLSRARIYVSDQAHHCVQKAARIAGFSRSAIRIVPTSDGRRIDPAAAEAAITQDRAGSGQGYPAGAGKHGAEPVEGCGQVPGAPGAAEQEHVAGQAGEPAGRACRVQDRPRVVVHRGDEVAGRNLPGRDGPAFGRADDVAECAGEQEPGHETERCPVGGAFHDGDQGGGGLAGRQLALVAGQPCGLGYPVELQRRLVECQPGDRRERPCRLDRDEGADAQPEDVVRLGVVKERAEVPGLLAGAVALAQGPLMPRPRRSGT